VPLKDVSPWPRNLILIKQEQQEKTEQ